MHASDIMTRELLTIAPETKVVEIAHLMDARRISALPVVDAAGRMLGMVSETDLVRMPDANGRPQRLGWSRFFRHARAALPRERTAADVMSRDVVMVDEDTSWKKLVELLAMPRIKRVPVLREGHLVGMVSRVDVLRVLAAQPGMAGVGERQWTHVHAG